MRAQPNWVGGVLSAFGAGLLTAAGFPPVDMPWLGLAGVVVGLWTFRRAPGIVWASLVGWAFGVGLFGVLLSWGLRFGTVAYGALVVSQAVWWIPVAVVAARSWARRRPFWWVVAVSATWTLSEAARARWPLGGYEWGQLGYLTHELPLRSAAGVVGTLGITALLVAGGAVVVAVGTERWPAKDLRRWSPLVVVLAMTVVLALAGARQWTNPSASSGSR